MNKSVMLALSLTPAALFADPSVERVIVRQQWPWSTDVKVEYSLSGVDANNPVDISVKAFNGETELPSATLDAAITGERYGVTSAVGSFLIDPIAAFGTSQIALGNFSVQLSVSGSSASMVEPLYKIIRIADGDCTDVSKADILNGKYGSYETDYRKIYSTYTNLADVIIWTGVTNNVAYKTTHIVMRKIKCKDIQWTMGEPDTLPYHNAGSPQCQVVLTNNFWIGVFPVTVGQWKSADPNTKGRTVSNGVYPENTNECVATSSSIKHFRAGSTTATHTFPQKKHSVSSDSLCGKLRALTGYDFELPTEAQWEFAAHGGVYSQSLYTGEEPTTDSELLEATKRVAWFNSNSKSGSYYYWHPVGSLNPNAYGLYDMLGSVAEVMRNRFYTYDTEHVTYEPEGGDDGVVVWRSYTLYNGFSGQRPGTRLRDVSGELQNNAYRGARLILPDTPGLVYPDFEKP